jgi:hypothetical protein
MYLNCDKVLKVQHNSLTKTRQQLINKQRKCHHKKRTAVLLSKTTITTTTTKQTTEVGDITTAVFHVLVRIQQISTRSF